MTFIDNSARTNWRFIGIIAILVVLTSVGILVFSAQKEAPSQFPQITTPELDITITGLLYQDFVSLLNKGKVKKVELFQGLYSTQARIILKEGQQAYDVIDIPGPPKNTLSQIEQEISRCGESCKDVEIVDRRDVSEEVNPPVETADWQTYRNEEFGFEIGYPAEFDVWGVSDRGISVTRRIGGKPRLTVGISVISEFGSLAEYLEHVKEVREFADEGQPSVYVIKERPNITVSGKRAFEQEIVGAASALYTIETFIEISPDLIISIIVRDDDGNSIDDSLRDLNDQILSTFRFIEPIDTSDWQTYRNEDFGFEVKYPEDVFAVVPIEENFVGYGESTNQGSKLMFANRKENLGSEECAYGETNFKSICRAESEDGIAFVFLPKRFADFQTQYTGYDAYREEIIGGRKGFSWGIDFEFTYRSVHYYIELEDEKTLYIQIMATGTLTYKEDEFGRYIYLPSKEMVDQILSTFRFIE